MTPYPAFERALEAMDRAALLRLYDAAMTQRTRAEDLVRGYELALRVAGQEREAAARALEPAGRAIRETSERRNEQAKTVTRKAKATNVVPQLLDLESL